MSSERAGPGIYTLILFLPVSGPIEIGSLGEMNFDRGYYSYTGSARGPGGLKRVDRHIQVAEGNKKTRRWHIDYLLPHCQVLDAVITKTSLDLECIIAKALEERLVSVPSFGCGDCNCISHLHYSLDLSRMKEAVAFAHSSALIFATALI
jgi:Uri superfamily endonuclease